MINIKINDNNPLLTVDDIVNVIIRNQKAIQNKIDELHTNGKHITSVDINVFTCNNLSDINLDPSVSTYVHDVQTVVDELQQKVLAVDIGTLSMYAYTPHMSDLLISIRAARKRIYDLIHYHLRGSLSTKCMEFCKQWAKSSIWTGRKMDACFWSSKVNAGLEGLMIPYGFGISQFNRMDRILLGGRYMLQKYILKYNGTLGIDSFFGDGYLMTVLIDNAIVRGDLKIIDMLSNYMSPLGMYFRQSIGLSEVDRNDEWIFDLPIRHAIVFTTLINYRPDIPIKAKIDTFNVNDPKSVANVIIREINNKQTFCSVMTSFDDAVLKSGVSEYATNVKPMLNLGIIEYAPMSLLQPIRDMICALHNGQMDMPTSLRESYKTNPGIIDQYIADKMFSH